MANNPWGGPSSASSNPWSSGGGSSPHHAHGVGGLFENLGKDVAGAVTGFIPGMVHLAEHPIGSVEQMGKSTWQTWSPLFHGHPGQFAHNFYDHPLQPLLDVASVFDLGLGAAGRLGKLTTAADELATSDSLLAKAARLRAPKRIQLEDPSGAGRIAFKNYSTRPLRRLTQEHVLPQLGKVAPDSVVSGLKNAQFEKAFRMDMAKRVLAKSTITNALMQVGQKLDGPDAFQARRKLAEGAHQNLFDHGFHMTPEQAVAKLVENPHYRPVSDPSQIRVHDYTAHIQALRNKVEKSTRKALQHAGAAHALPGLESELQRQEVQLAHMREHGYQIVMPAKTKLKEPTAKQLMERNAAPLVEVQQNIKRLRSQIDKARKSKAIVDKAHGDINTYGDQLLEAQRAAHKNVFDHFASTPDSFQRYAKNLGRYGVVGIRTGKGGAISHEAAAKAIEKAMVDQHGMVSLVPKHDPTMLGHELGNSSRMVRMLWRKPTRIWKMGVVGFTPRTITNNGIGNLLIYMSREDPLTGLWGLYHGYRLSKGVDKATADYFDTATKSGILRKFFTPDMANVFGHDVMAEGRAGRLSQLKSGAYPLVHRLADIPVRAGAILSYLRRDPLVQKYMKAGQSFEEAAHRALLEDPGLKARASEHATSIGGDYINTNKTEKVVKDIAPFYLWDRHIVKSTGNLVKDTPTRAVVGQQISNQGEAQTEKALGHVPSYLAGALPLSMLGLGSAKGERVNVLSTTSLNPFNTIGDLAHTAQALTVGHSPDAASDLFSQVNPFLTGAVSYATGSSFGGAKVAKHGGAIPSVLGNALQSFPEFKITQGFLSPAQTTTASGKEKLFATGETPAVSSFLGVPIKSVGKQAAQAAYKKEQGGSSKKRKKTNPWA